MTDRDPATAVDEQAMQNAIAIELVRDRRRGWERARAAAYRAAYDGARVHDFAERPRWWLYLLFEFGPVDLRRIVAETKMKDWDKAHPLGDWLRGAASDGAA